MWIGELVALEWTIALSMHTGSNKQLAGLWHVVIKLRKRARRSWS